MCQFFTEFSSSHMIGCQEKVPVIRHDMTLVEWLAVGKLLVYCSRVGYWPFYFSEVFMLATLYGEAEMSDSILRESFNLYVSCEEKDTIKEMLDNYDPTNDGLNDLCSDYECKFVPKKLDDFVVVLKELAHKELIQKPKYIANCFTDVFKENRISFFKNVGEFRQFYKGKKPSCRKVAKSMIASGVTSASQKLVMTYLQQFVRSLDTNKLSLFLRFVTGGDLPPEYIIVNFKDQSAMSRAPRARTCGSILEISEEYACYNDLQEEFSNVLANKESFKFSFG